MQTIIIGLLVAFASFGVMQFIVLKHFKSFTLPALVFMVAGGLGFAFYFPEGLRPLYQFGWMAAMFSSVVIFALGKMLGNAARRQPPRK